MADSDELKHRIDAIVLEVRRAIITMSQVDARISDIQGETMVLGITSSNPNAQGAVMISELLKTQSNLLMSSLHDYMDRLCKYRASL